MKNCTNCELKDMCYINTMWTNEKKECKNWQGWIKCEDEPYPKDESALLFAHLPSVDIYICNNKELPANVDVEIKAWRPMPKYKEKQ